MSAHKGLAPSGTGQITEKMNCMSMEPKPDEEMK